MRVTPSMLVRAAAPAIAWVALFSVGCTLSNTAEGGPEGLEAMMGRDGPAEESLELWATPGDNLLAALAQIEENDAQAVLAPDNFVLGIMLNELGAYRSAALSYQPFGTPYLGENMQCEESELPEAIETLCDVLLGEDLRVIFLDAAEHFAQHRAFARRILGCARDAGIEYLAIEALEEPSADLIARGHVSRTRSGVFMREPQLARLVEEGLALGFTPVSFPFAGDLCTNCGVIQRFSEFSEQKAESLLAETFEVNPEARVLVLAAQGQAYKTQWGPRPFVNSLAYQVIEKTGLDPVRSVYSAVQFTLNPGTALGDPSDTDTYLASGPSNGSCAGSYSPASATGDPTLNAVVFHVAPDVSDDLERWAWLHTLPEERMAVTPMCVACLPGTRLLVQAFPSGVDIADRVPLDQALCEAGVSCQLSLPAGDYQIVIWSEEAELASTSATLVAGSAIPVGIE